MKNDTLLKKKDEFPLSEHNFLYLKILAVRCGIDLNEYKERIIHNRLVKRIRELKLNSFDEYCSLLRINLDEEIKFINLITNPTTFFFRENHHFEFLKEYLLTLLSKKNKIRIWSSGCSTGEEAYSIAMVIFENVKNIAQYDIKILATDINEDSLIKAESGIYSKDEIEEVDAMRKNKWFQKISTEEGQQFKVIESLRSLITFNHLNLMDPWPLHQPVDIIFCRNVLIYFKADKVNMILKKFHDLLEKNGLLFLGHSENLLEQKPFFVTVGKTIYQKIS